MSKQLQKQQANAVANSIDANQPLIMPDEVRLPIAGIVQDKNHFLKQDPEKYELGQIIAIGTGEIISKQDAKGAHALNFIPIHMKRIWVCKNPRQSDNKLYDKSFEPNQLIWKTENPADSRILQEENLAKENECKARVNKFLQFMSYVEGYDMPLIISFGKSGKRAGEDLLTRLTFAFQGPKNIQFWEQKYKLTTFLDNYQGHDFFRYAFEKIEEGPTKDELELAQAWASTVATQNYQPDVEEFEEDEEIPPAVKPSVGKAPSSEDDSPY